MTTGTDEEERVNFHLDEKVLAATQDPSFLLLHKVCWDDEEVRSESHKIPALSQSRLACALYIGSYLQSHNAVV